MKRQAAARIAPVVVRGNQPGEKSGIRRGELRVGRAMLIDGALLLGLLALLVAALAVAHALGNGVGDTTGDVVLPVVKGSYRTTAEFGDSEGPWKNTHTGLDFAASEGTEIHAVTAGVVIYAQDSGGPYGNLTKVSRSDGTKTWYAHQSVISVAVGATVTAGEVIGAVGATGNVTGAHVHLEIRIDGLATDPRAWLIAHGAIP